MLRERLTESIGDSGQIEVVGYADTEQQAIESLMKVDCDAIVLDLRLQEGNGFNVLKMLRDTPASRRTIIVFTNYSLPQFRERSMELGANYFLDKGRESDRVREILEELATAERRTDD